MVNKEIEVIFFDIDDTLLNSSESQYKAIIEFKKNIKMFENISDSEFAKIWNKVTFEQYEKYAKREVSFEEHRINRMKNLFYNFNVNISDNEAEKFFKIFMKLNEKCWMLFDDTLEVIKKLNKKYILAVITNGDGIQQRKKLRKMKIEKYFREIIVSKEVEVSKPDERIFKIACNKLNVQSKKCVMCGDQYKTDIIGAINSGIQAIWLNRKNEIIEYDYQIKNLKEILEIL